MLADATGRKTRRRESLTAQFHAPELYAMFDEVDEGTAMFKLAPTRDSVPAGLPLVTLDADGDQLPSDWYLQLARQAQQRLSAIRR